MRPGESSEGPGAIIIQSQGARACGGRRPGTSAAAAGYHQPRRVAEPATGGRGATFSMGMGFMARRVRALAWGALLGLAAACGGDAASPSTYDGVDRETFIATYVDLRTAAIRAEDHELSDAERARILTRHGVTEEALLGFAAFHGEDVAFMRGVWDEVEARLDAVRFLPGADEPR